MTMKIDCVCPPAAGGPRHPGGDTVVLREKLDFRSALTVRNAIIMAKQDDPDMDAPEILALLTEKYLLLGIESWSLTDAKGKKVEPTRDAIRAFTQEHPDEAMEVGDAADALYSAAVILPLVERASKSSPTSPTNGSTSPTTGSPPALPKPSRRSSTSTIPMADTDMTSASPGGVSN